MEKIKDMILESMEVKRLVKEQLTSEINDFIGIVTEALGNGKKILIAGNGGSASQASHIAAEFVGRYKIERRGLPCIALTTDSSIVTAWSNDYGFETLFSRQLEALANEGDVFIALSTSGNSKNLIEGVSKGKELGLKVVSLLGKGGGEMKGVSDIDIIVPSDNTPKIQEAHLMILHIMCELVDKKLFGE